MNQAAVDPFATTVQETGLWINEIGEKIGAGKDKDLAWALLGVTIHALRDRMQPGAAIHFGAQLPTLVRGLYYEHWSIDGSTTKERHKAAFLDHVRSMLPSAAQAEAEPILKAVFAIVRRRIDPGEIAKVARQMPKELRDLWE